MNDFIQILQILSPHILLTCLLIIIAILMAKFLDM